MKKMNMLWTKIAAIALGAILTVGVGATLSSLSPSSEVEAATAQTNRRLYVYTKDGWNQDTPYIYYWGGGVASPNYNAAPAMTEVVNDWWNGLFYFDLPVAATNYLLKNAAYGDGTVKTNDLNVADAFPPNDYKIVETWGGGGSVYAQPSLSNMDAGQFAAILSKIDSCSYSYASGVNAYPQINDLFYTNADKTYHYNTDVPDQKNLANESINVTITDKYNFISARYNNQDLASAIFTGSNTNNESRLAIIILTSLVGLSTITGFYFLSRKRKANQF
jgi:hypothetical protein